MREGAGGKEVVEHHHPMPVEDVGEPREMDEEDLYRGKFSPFVSQRIDILNDGSAETHTKKARQWIKARGVISEAGGHQAHLSALAYMSDSYFIGTVARVHKLWRHTTNTARNNKQAGAGGKLGITPEVIQKLQSMDEDTLKRMEGMDDDVIAQLRSLAVQGGEVVFKEGSGGPKEIGMMVSLDHSIYFHSPRDFRADEWLYTECESPWSGDGRGLVMQRMYTREGLLVASCVQEVSFFSFLYDAEWCRVVMLSGLPGSCEVTAGFTGVEAVIRMEMGWLLRRFDLVVGVCCSLLLEEIRPIVSVALGYAYLHVGRSLDLNIETRLGNFTIQHRLLSGRCLPSIVDHA